VPLRVLQPGLCTLLVDLGRPACRSLGMSVGGAADRSALAIGNSLVGNAPDSAALEIAFAGPTLRCDCDLACVVYGAPFVLSSDGQALKVGVTFTLPAQEELRIGGTPRGARAYLCVQGGLEAKRVLDSCSSLQPLTTGTEIGCRAGRIGSRSVQTRSSVNDQPCVLRALQGAQADWFEQAAFFEQRFHVHPASNRMGIRLSGEAISRTGRHALRTVELVSEPTCPGTVQVTNDGQCIILGVDGQTIGGYPKIAQVISANIDRLAQLRPGDEVVFAQVALEEAERLYRAKQQELSALITRLRASLGA
jgi:5-oxoprolinase (ATP-hydrolysing) subunit C